MNDNQVKPEAGAQGEPQVRSSAVLGSTVYSGEMWALLTDDGIQNIHPTADRVIAELSGNIGRTEEWTRAFMEQNGWLLVRVQTSHKIVAVLKTMNEKALPNEKAVPPSGNGRGAQPKEPNAN